MCIHLVGPTNYLNGLSPAMRALLSSMSIYVSSNISSRSRHVLVVMVSSLQTDAPFSLLISRHELFSLGSTPGGGVTEIF